MLYGARLARGIALPSMWDRDTGLGVGFLRGFGDESDTVSSAHQLMFPARCSDNRNTGRDAVLPAARCF